MKYFYTVLLYMLLGTSLFAQHIPEVTLNDNSKLKLTSLNVEVNITGNIALTTYKMKFYNGTNSVLEGELAFPLGQSQSVTDFAMDVNGKMRHAAIVEKELGRVAYESTIRKTIDPGLLEMTKGNNYKARIYPIPANGYKDIEITYEQTLVSNNERHTYQIPLAFKSKLDNFSIEIRAFGKENISIVENSIYKSLRFKKGLDCNTASFKAVNFTPSETVNIEMKFDGKSNLSTYNNYFNFYKTFESKSRLKTKPKSITVFWDASYSMENRKLDKEIKFLDAYIKYLGTINLKLVVFNTKVKNDKTYKIKNGDWQNLKQALRKVIYDGGTSYLNLENYTSETCLFFTDGMFNLGDFHLKNKAPVYTINSLASANHNRLSKLSNNSRANYINLSAVSVKNAMDIIKKENYKFIGISENDKVYELFPLPNTTVNQDFALSGRFKGETTLELLFGYDNIIVDTVKVFITNKENSRVVKRLWAKQKLNVLVENAEKNKKEIIQLAKRNHLITAFTSMIILDRVEDYAKYKIEPPAELKSRYKELVRIEEENELERQEEINMRNNQLYTDYKNLMNWYYKDFSKEFNKKKETKASVGDQGTESMQNNSVSVSNSTAENTGFTRTIDSTKRVVTGHVKDENGVVIPGVSIYLQDSSISAVTDFNGNYAINAEIGDELIFSFIGYTTKEVGLASNLVVNVTLSEDSSALEEVVVVGYGTQRRTSITGAVMVVKSESVKNLMDNSMVEALQGRISGVEVDSNNLGVGEASTAINIHGAGLEDSNTPLYIVDGKPYAEGDLKAIEIKNIDNIRVLKNGEGSSIYGSRAANGVILISTKEGMVKNRSIIKDLNERIDKEITFKPWKSKADYLIAISQAKDKVSAYNMYLELRKEYKNTPTFFIDVTEYFESIDEKEIAIQVVTNLVEMDIDNHELSRALAYKLEHLKEYGLAVYVYEAILELRPEEPHSYRDLALGYEQIGEYQKAFDLLYKIANGELLKKDEDERFYGIEQIAYVEACHVLTKHKEKLKLTDNQKVLLKRFEVDIRVVVDWNHNDTDLDLWVENPNKEKLLYSNKKSQDGGRISEDITEGYGPEEFMIKKASKGDYEILIDYYGDRIQKISGPTTLKVTVFTNYGKKNEKKEVRILRLNKEEDEIEVGTVSL